MPSSGDLPNPGIAPRSPALKVDSLLSESPGKPGFTFTKALIFLHLTKFIVTNIYSFKAACQQSLELRKQTFHFIEKLCVLFN